MPFKDVDSKKEYKRLYYLRKKAGLPTRTTVVLSPEERFLRQKESRKKFNLKLRKRNRQQIDEIYGKQCYICQNERKLLLHKKDGKKHMNGTAMSMALKSPQDFVRVCFRCHSGIHFCMNILKMNWETINNIVKVLYNR